MESLLACKAFVRASEDPVRGNGRKYADFAAEVLAAYKASASDHLDSDTMSEADRTALTTLPRTGEAIVQRHKKVRRSCMDFEGSMRQVLACKPTGDPSEDDLCRAATAVYNERAQPRDMYQFFGGAGDPGRAFPFARQLAYLRGTSLWKVAALAGSTVAPTPGPENDPTTAVGSSSGSGFVSGSCSGDAASQDAGKPAVFTRPVGSKRAAGDKGAAALARGAEGIEALARASEKRARVASELVKVEQFKADMQLFMMPGGVESDRLLFVKKMQADALKRMGAAPMPVGNTEEAVEYSTEE